MDRIDQLEEELLEARGILHTLVEIIEMSECDSIEIRLPRIIEKANKYLSSEESV